MTDRSSTEDDHLSVFHPVVATWFRQRFGQPTPVQAKAWAAIQSGHHTLIASPTGTGKTLAAMLPGLDQIVRSLAGRLQSPSDITPTVQLDVGVQLLYVAPLKALNNDIHINLTHHVQQLNSLATAAGYQRFDLRLGVRTGDTTSGQRSAMLRKPPHVLMTTPESLYILLTSERGRAMLRTVRTVIVDEIHELVDSKRGHHLSVSLERLSRLCPEPLQRVGVSATQRPIGVVAQYLGGWETVDQQPCARAVCIVEHDVDKRYDVQIVVPNWEVSGRDRENYWLPVVREIAQVLDGCNTLLVFVNNRRLCERLTLRLNDFYGAEVAGSHHGSMSKERRLQMEQHLRTGVLKCIVATSSLELGIDVGHVDAVLQVDSPKTTAAGVQRIGRAGHFVDGTSRGVLLVKNRAELAEAAVIAARISKRTIEHLELPEPSIEVLFQHVASMVAMEPWDPDALFTFLRQSHVFRGLTRSDFEGVLQVLTGYFPFVRPLIDQNPASGTLTRRAGTALVALMGAGTIPQSSGYPVYHRTTRVHLGELDEEFVHESRTGDVFQLGTSSWLIQSIETGGVYVSESPNRYSEVPFWRGESIGRTVELGEEVGRFQHLLHNQVQVSELGAVAWLTGEYHLSTDAAAELTRLIKDQSTSAHVPTHQRIVLERFTDEMGKVHLILHSLLGKRLNQTWLLALRLRFEQLLGEQIYAYAKDDGLHFVFPSWDARLLQGFWDVTANRVRDLLLEALPASPMFAIRFRRMAETALLLTRRATRTPMWQKRLRSESLLREALPYGTSFVLTGAAMTDCLLDVLDLNGLLRVLTQIDQGHIAVQYADVRSPSPMARVFLADYAEDKLYEADALQVDLQRQLLSINRTFAETQFGSDVVSRSLDEAVLQSERDRLSIGNGAGQVIDSAEALYQAIKQLGDLSTDELLQRTTADGMRWLTQLNANGQLVAVSVAGQERWICADEQRTYDTIASTASSTQFVLRRFVSKRMSFSVDDIRERYGLSAEQLTAILKDWTVEGFIESSVIEPDHSEQRFMTCHRVAQLIRQTVARARREAEPTDGSQLLRLAVAKHHLLDSGKLTGIDGLRQIIRALQGVFLPHSQWEGVVFPSRMTGYRKDDLDLLCATGEVRWVGRREPGQKEGKIAFFLSDDPLLYRPFSSTPNDDSIVHAEVYDQLKRRGASFAAQLGNDTGLSPSVLLEQLFDLVWAGLVSNDQFAPIRFCDPKPSQKTNPLRASVGRWYAVDAITSADEGEASMAQSAVRWAQALLNLHGVVSKPVVTEDVPYTWDTMRAAFEQLEVWGTATRGLFLRDVPYLQFASREFATTLKVNRTESLTGDVVLPAIDPANPYGQLLPWPQLEGPRFARKLGNYLVIRDGIWVLWVESHGKRVWSIQASDSDTSKDSLKALIRQIGSRKLKLETWDGVPTGQSSMAEVLMGMGAERDRESLVLWSLSVR